MKHGTAMRLTKPHPVVINLQILIAIFLTFFLIDLIGAHSAVSCGAATRGEIPNASTQVCYPWGAEGPVAGVWNYSTKHRYLVSVYFMAAWLLAALLVPFFVRGLLAGVLAMVFVLVFGGFTIGMLLPILVN